jgi:hypothetical protein
MGTTEWASLGHAVGYVVLLKIVKERYRRNGIVSYQEHGEAG